MSRRLAGIGNDEVFKLEEDPSSFITPAADYNDGTSSTFGSPNIYSAGSEQQDFTALRAEGLNTLCTVPDMDGDGICDQLDNCPAVTNADQSDMDADGIGDLCDACPNDAANNEDGDGWCADQDNCPFVSNDQADGDGDGVGDVCDICPGDVDPDQEDEDGDGIGDACDMCPGDPINDPDIDGVCYSVDNLPRRLTCLTPTLQLP